jgi:hypothetical protein
MASMNNVRLGFNARSLWQCVMVRRTVVVLLEVRSGGAIGRSHLENRVESERNPEWRDLS